MANLLDTLRAHIKQMKYGSTFTPTPGNMLDDLANPNSLRSKDLQDILRGIRTTGEKVNTAKQPIVKPIKKATEYADKLIQFLHQHVGDLIKNARN